MSAPAPDPEADAPDPEAPAPEPEVRAPDPEAPAPDRASGDPPPLHRRVFDGGAAVAGGGAVASGPVLLTVLYFEAPPVGLSDVPALFGVALGLALCLSAALAPLEVTAVLWRQVGRRAAVLGLLAPAAAVALVAAALAWIRGLGRGDPPEVIADELLRTLWRARSLALVAALAPSFALLGAARVLRPGLLAAAALGAAGLGLSAVALRASRGLPVAHHGVTVSVVLGASAAAGMVLGDRLAPRAAAWVARRWVAITSRDR